MIPADHAKNVSIPFLRPVSRFLICLIQRKKKRDFSADNMVLLRYSANSVLRMGQMTKNGSRVLCGKNGCYLSQKQNGALYGGLKESHFHVVEPKLP